MASERASYPDGWDPRPDAHVAPPSVLRAIPSNRVPTQIRDAFAGSTRMQNATTSPGRVSLCQVVPPSRLRRTLVNVAAQIVEALVGETATELTSCPRRPA